MVGSWFVLVTALTASRAFLGFSEVAIWCLRLRVSDSSSSNGGLSRSGMWGTAGVDNLLPTCSLDDVLSVFVGTV